jgi:hypothetical protein
MFDVSKLREITHIISHRGCPDGIGSVMVVQDVLPDIKVTYLDHNTFEHINLKPEPNMLFCDFIPHQNNIQAFFDQEAIILDHHNSNKILIQDYRYAIFADAVEQPGIAGTNLAFNEVWIPLIAQAKSSQNDVRLFSKLIGIRDTWQRRDPAWDAATAHSFAIKFFDSSHWERHVPKLTSMEMNIGNVIFNRLKLIVKSSDSKCIKYNYKDYKLCYIPLYDQYFSDCAEYLLENGNDIVIGFNYIFEDGKQKLDVSLRSFKVDVGNLASLLGGGGHRKASGFRLNIENINPLEVLKNSIEYYI